MVTVSSGCFRSFTSLTKSALSMNFSKINSRKTDHFMFTVVLLKKVLTIVQAVYLSIASSG